MEDELAFGPRFSVAARIGAGGMGVVYRAYDRERKAWVALKSVALPDPTAVMRFKNEFRSLVDVSHPNLVSLNELHSCDGKLFFTMELVEGSDLETWLRGSINVAELDTLSDPFATEQASAGTSARRTSVAPDAKRLRPAMAQLAAGLSALHAAGKLHRDVKPSNVLVDRQGRVVLCDFGLVIDQFRDHAAITDAHVVGTVEYMSPEQAAGSDLTEASDWYSVGVILYQLLVGELPYQGARMKVLLDKQQFDPKRPRDLDPTIAPDLDELTVALLARDPTKRPTRERILHALGAAGFAEPAGPASVSLASMHAPFVGRDRMLASLSTAFDDARRGHPVTVWVQGSSGMGKSQLVRRFLDILAQRTDAVILQGRCYERDSVPYKALDSIIDALTRHLVKLPRTDVEAFLPRDILALARVFPVLRRVPSIANAPQRRTAAPDPQELRRRAFDALRELLGRIGDRTPLVVWIDDLQWGDSDSAVLLADIMSPPNPPAVLLLVSFREEDSGTSPALAALMAGGDNNDRTQTDTRMINVGPLAASDAVSLAHTLLGAGVGDRDEVARTIATESRGIPFFIDELVRHAQSGIALRKSALGKALRLEEVLGSRIETLPDGARHLLEVIAVAARPVECAIAARAAQLSAEDERSLFGVLRAARMIRSSGARGRESVECYHDRIRQTALGLIDEATIRGLHAALASAYETAEHPNVDALMMHFRGAGALDRAAEYAVRAADRAADALAFDRAAALYRVALELGAADRVIRRKLADALANAGNGADAANAYREASVGAPAAEAIDLRRRAAEQLLRCGQVEQGIIAAREVLALVHLSFPQSRAWALFRIVFTIVLLRLRGLHYRERDESQLSAEERIRLDVAWTVGSSLGLVDTIRALALQHHHTLLALRAGDGFRIARAIGTEALARAARGNARELPQLIEVARTIAAKLDDPYVRGWAALTRGAAAFLCGRFREAVTDCTEAEQTFRDSCTGASWELANAQIFGLWAQYHLGDLKALTDRLPRLVRAAQERGDLYLRTALRIGRPNIVWLVANDPDRARRELDEAMDRWPRTEFHLQHFYAMLGAAQIELYRGRASRAVAIIEETWPRLRSAFLLRVQTVNIEGQHLRARCALAVLSEGGDGALMKVVTQAIRAIRRQRTKWGDALALLLDAAVAHQNGRREQAIEILARADRELSELNMEVWAAAARLRRAALLGDNKTVTDVERALSAQSIRAPKRFADLLAPGFTEKSA